ncbi:MAG TPA: alpha/beta hydrolase [Acidimicrobiales bacterium]|nr:alpha/beta hydrolase [Acidimicrobiales bacterium]
MAREGRTTVPPGPFGTDPGRVPAVPVVLTPDGVEINYFDLGGSGPPVLMVHATGFHGHMWQPIADRLQDDFHCWALDLRGHGDSGPPPDLDFSWSGFAQDIRAVVDRLGLERPRAVGHSLGGANSLFVEQLAPGTFSSIYAYEPAIWVPVPEGVGDDGSTAVDLALRRRAHFPSRQAALANYAAKAPMDSFAPECLAAYVEHGFAEDGDGSVHLKCRPEYEAGAFRGFAGTTIYARLPEVRCPVVIARGSDPGSQAAERNEVFVSQLPHGRGEELAGLNHFGPQQSPTALGDSIRTALGAELTVERCGASER